MQNEFDRKSFTKCLLSRQKKTGEEMIDILLDVFENDNILIDFYNYKKYINSKIKKILKKEGMKNKLLTM